MLKNDWDQWSICKKKHLGACEQPLPQNVISSGVSDPCCTTKPMGYTYLLVHLYLFQFLLNLLGGWGKNILVRDSPLNALVRPHYFFEGIVLATSHIN